MPASRVAMRYPPAIPTISPMIVRMGKTKKQATIRGTIKNSTGSTPSVRVASTWSLTLIVPNSAVIRAPALPEKISAVKTGPSSRTNESPTRCAMYSLAPKRTIAVYPCRAKTAPEANEVMTMIITDWMPCSYICLRTSGQRIRPRAMCPVISPKKHTAPPERATHCIPQSINAFMPSCLFSSPPEGREAHCGRRLPAATTGGVENGTRGAHRVLKRPVIRHDNDILFMLCLFDHPDDLFVGAFLPRKNNLDR